MLLVRSLCELGRRRDVAHRQVLAVGQRYGEEGRADERAEHQRIEKRFFARSSRPRKVWTLAAEDRFAFSVQEPTPFAAQHDAPRYDRADRVSAPPLADDGRTNDPTHFAQVKVGKRYVDP